MPNPSSKNQNTKNQKTKKMIIYVLFVLSLFSGTACGHRYMHRSSSHRRRSVSAISTASAATGISSSQLKMAATTDATAAAAALTTVVKASTADSPKLKFDKLFEAFATSEYFVHHVWQKQPHYVDEPLACAVGAYTMDDVQQAVDSDFLEAGRGTFQEGRGGWNMAAVSTVSCQGYPARNT